MLQYHPISRYLFKVCETLFSSPEQLPSALCVSKPIRFRAQAVSLFNHRSLKRRDSPNSTTWKSYLQPLHEHNTWCLCSYHSTVPKYSQWHIDVTLSLRLLSRPWINVEDEMQGWRLPLWWTEKIYGGIYFYLKYIVHIQKIKYFFKMAITLKRFSGEKCIPSVNES